ncbi:MAG: hypothetical protein COT85_02020 [Chlamydiae bacterium CG10_big_fil_rev_8_21_14_0_10_42_34]|nr:MAG: hypothetical protein COT85_02020 [Chlamydiae bacterium CG10_big_fil_rev_8_21_14_0_10_42_34]
MAVQLGNNPNNIFPGQPSVPSPYNPPHMQGVVPQLNLPPQRSQSAPVFSSAATPGTVNRLALLILQGRLMEGLPLLPEEVTRNPVERVNEDLKKNHISLVVTEKAQPVTKSDDLSIPLGVDERDLQNILNVWARTHGFAEE